MSIEAHLKQEQLPEVRKRMETILKGVQDMEEGLKGLTEMVVLWSTSASWLARDWEALMLEKAHLEAQGKLFKE